MLNKRLERFSSSCGNEGGERGLCGHLNGEKVLKVLCREYTYGGHSSGGIKINLPDFTNPKIRVLKSKFICMELTGQPVTNSGIQMFGGPKIQAFRFQVVRNSCVQISGGQN